MKVIALESITLNPNSIMEATLLSVPMVQNHSAFAEEAEYVPFEEVREKERKGFYQIQCEFLGSQHF